jgi:hypothetical protein
MARAPRLWPAGLPRDWRLIQSPNSRCRMGKYEARPGARAFGHSGGVLLSRRSSASRIIA